MTSTQDERKRREALSDHEAMAEAQSGCVPCKLCGGKAIISDAGEGAGYYVRCENSGAFRASQGCMVTDCRLGGWAFNVMEWWNRLHSLPAPDTATSVAEEWCAYMDEAVSKAPEPLRKLGEYLSGLLDEDQWKTSERLLNAAVITAPQAPATGGKFKLGDRVTKTKGSKWTGRVVGFYSTTLTAIGYAVESETETGSVQIYPEAALAALSTGDAEGGV